MPNGPAIYVASLSDYNAGRLHGRWIDATLGIDHIRDEIADMLAESRDPHAEEWAIHDYNEFGGLRLGEYENLEKIAELGELLEEHGELLLGVVDYFGGLDYLDEAVETLTDRHAGSGDTLEDWAGNYLDETGALSGLDEHLRNYFDYEKYARDLELGGEVFTVDVDGTVHVFWTR